MSNAVAERPKRANAEKLSLRALHRELEELRERVEDLRDLRAAKGEEADAKTMSLREVQARYGAK